MYFHDLKSESLKEIFAFNDLKAKTRNISLLPLTFLVLELAFPSASSSVENMTFNEYIKNGNMRDQVSLKSTMVH